MKKLLLIATTIVVSAYAQAQFLDIPMTEITGANFVCGHKGGGFAVNVKEQKIWQTDGSELVQGSIGIPLSNVFITEERFEGTLENVIKIMAGYVDGGHTEVEVTIYNLEQKQEEGKVRLPCRPVPAELEKSEDYQLNF